jgi:hypothetical protein
MATNDPSGNDIALQDVPARDKEQTTSSKALRHHPVKYLRAS